MLSDLVDVEQNVKYHPEGSVWNHTMMVVDEAAQRRGKSEEPAVFMWGALLHDIGKKPATMVRKGKITSYNHERIGSRMAVELLKSLDREPGFVDRVRALVRWHMEPLFVNKGLPFLNIKNMLKEVSLDEIALLSACDRLGRGDMSEQKIEDEMKGIDFFLERCRKVQDKNH
jgi:putative nucleotidyltransferase with HDIG domain